MTDEAPMLTAEMEAAIRRRVEAATPGPWEVESWRDDEYGPTEQYVGMRMAPEGWWDIDSTMLTPGDAEFIAHARTDIPTLLATFDQLRERLAQAEAERDGARKLGAFTARRYVALLERLVEREQAPEPQGAGADERHRFVAMCGDQAHDCVCRHLVNLRACMAVRDADIHRVPDDAPSGEGEG